MAHIPQNDGRPPWHLTVVTLFPEMFPGPLATSLTGQALTAGIWTLDTVDLRSHGIGRHRAVDDSPAGGGAGMVLRPDVVAAALDDARAKSPTAPMIYLSPRGAPLTQAHAASWSKGPGLILLAGRFEGVDERVIAARDLQEVSLGDYVLSGGELAAMVLADACLRLLPGVLGGGVDSLCEESFENGLLEYPQYTKPREWEGHPTPDVLLSGDHQKIAAWRRAQAVALTTARRPDLIKPK
jgi:tRNA (guanine37-N1)-methyltransferase